MQMQPSESDVQTVRKGLQEFNDRTVGPDGHLPLELVEYDGEGAVSGGLLGGTYWGWLYIDVLWVREDSRRKGIGSALLRRAEEEARARGCHHAHVDTMSWQAPAFYAKYGYRLIGILPDIPTGRQKYLYQKEL